LILDWCVQEQPPNSKTEKSKIENQKSKMFLAV
jgi:hypothetical protein